MLDDLFSTARQARRQLAQRPGTTVLVILTLTIALGLNAGHLATIDALILRPLPFPNVDRLLQLSEFRQTTPNQRQPVSFANVEDWRRAARTVDLVAIGMPNVALSGREAPERMQSARVSAGFFEMVGERPQQGRVFTGSEFERGAHTRVVLSDSLWRQRFGGDPAVVGSVVRLDGVPHEVVGIASRGFEFPFGTRVWTPLALTDAERADRERRTLMVMGQLKPGVSLDAARAEFAAIGEQVSTIDPANRERRIRVQTLVDGVVEPAMRTPVLLGQVSGLFLLLIGCANIAGLLLARGVDRQREVAIRLALGASRRQVLQTLAAEGVLLGAAAIPLALGVGAATLRLIQQSMPPRLAPLIPGWATLHIDLRVVLVLVVLALLTTVLLSLVPARQLMASSLTALADGARGSTSGPSRQWLRRGLVVAQLMLALPLLIVAILSARGTSALLYGPQGYDPDNLLTLQLQLADNQYAGDDARRAFARNALERLRALNPVTSVAITNALPASGANPDQELEAEGQPLIRDGDVDVDLRVISPSYFRTMAIPLLTGRDFTDTDSERSEGVVIVSEALARRYWPDGEALGRRIRYSGEQAGPWLTVVGVSADLIHDAINSRREPTLYRPIAQAPLQRLSFAIRTTGVDPSSVTTAARAALASLDDTQPVYNAMSMRQLLDERLIALRQLTVSSWALGAMALGLGLLGLYGVMAYFVSQRTHEIGVRLALGATVGDVARLVLRQSGMLLAIGVGAGALLAVALGRGLEAAVIGISSVNVGLVAATASALALVGLLASCVPMRRAMRLDPVVALREH